MMTDQRPVYSVTQVNQHIKGLLDRDRALSGILVRGELSNYKMYPSGHHYFSLKDETGAIRCVMFKREAMGLRFRPENGMKVIAAGRITVFPRDGQYQLYCDQLLVDGVGDLHAAFERLKEKLAVEGLFGPERKQPIPRFPGKIVLITSSAGAAVRDMIRVLGARWPMAEVLLIPARVQGVEAPAELCAAVALANRERLGDLIIIGRGGGSMEDLWAFNDENLARTIEASAIPVISAVGHEPDVTISDYVADLRAATPSNGAELAVPDQNDIAVWFNQMTGRLVQATQRRLQNEQRRLQRAAQSPVLRDPTRFFAERRQLLDMQRSRLAHGMSRAMAGEREHLARLAAGLDAMSPLKVLGRGYAIARYGGTVLRSVEQVKPNMELTLRLSDGTVRCRAEEELPNG